ncbi:MAG: deoxyribodipyrimidine photo-lyase [Actinomycetia bacterium]|nr:deoxyribodipyrimidine photo-lyase [Actinomycetes bacterium]
MNYPRHRELKKGKTGCGAVAFWMSRDQRSDDNWALLFAQGRAKELNRPLITFFYLSDQFLNADKSHFWFMLEGLKMVEKNLNRKNIPFYLVQGKLEDIAAFLNQKNTAELVTDFDPLNIKRKWKKQILTRINIPVYEVDTHNIVPCWIVSDKQEYAAYTIRPKINRLKSKYLTGFIKLTRQQSMPDSSYRPPNWDDIYRKLQIGNIKPAFKAKPGEEAAFKTLEIFLESKLNHYGQKRNNPNLDATSGLSPYLHWGQISAQRIVLEALKFKPDSNLESFLEELIIRRELSDNFCYYNQNYDKFEGFSSWAKKTLLQHCKDKRPYTYNLEQLEGAQTHDMVWNAAQKQMLITGSMHGYLRMYWAKKILEWTPGPRQALEYALYLNNRYQLDGRDPNGYTGIAWSIGGVHDRAWNQRDVFGKIRYMSLAGLKRKFDTSAYISKIKKIEQNIYQDS